MNKASITFMASALFCQSVIAADTISEALSSGVASGDFRLRYESVEQNNALEDASALTIRSRLGYTTGEFKGLTATIEFEDSRIAFGESDYSVGPTGFKVGQYSIIGDPEVTEIDQAYIAAKGDSISLKIGRQVITFDNHRHVGHVGWRQDRQTFDAGKVVYKLTPDLKFTYAFLDQRNRIFAEAADVDSADSLFNFTYKTGFGKVGAYGYLLENEDAGPNDLDTYGVYLKGATKMDSTKVMYMVEFASQESESGATQRDATYMLFEGGAVIGGVTAKLGYEVLGSDGGMYGFATPLATLHKFNGWSDQFLGTPAQGLVDLYLSVSGKAGGGKWVAVYHDFSADESTATVDDMGSEINLLYAKKFGKNYNTGVKYAAYSAGDAAAGKVDTDKLWVWVGASF